jgi:hypothetical protein
MAEPDYEAPQIETIGPADEITGATKISGGDGDQLDPLQ